MIFFVLNSRHPRRSRHSRRRRGSVARSVSPPQRGVARPRTGAGRPGRGAGAGDGHSLAATGDTGFDAHLAEALGEEEMSDHCSSNSEEDDNDEAIS